MLRLSGLFAVLLSVLTGSPCAAQSHNWTGIYLGGQVGAQLGTVDVKYFDIYLDREGLKAASYSGFIGARWQSVVVLGIQATILGARESLSEGSAVSNTVADLARGRMLEGQIGVPIGPNALLYAKGGYAGFNFDHGAEDVGVGSRSLHGWSAGIGLDYAVTKHTFVRLEATHISLSPARFESAEVCDVSLASLATRCSAIFERSAGVSSQLLTVGFGVAF